MRTFGTWIVSALLAFAAVPTTADPLPNTDGEACLEIVRNGLRRQHTFSDSSGSVRRLYTVRVVPRGTGPVDTLTAHADVVESDGMQVTRADGREIWTDEDYMIVLDTASKVVDVTGLRSRRKLVSAQRRLAAHFPDSLTDGAGNVDCQPIDAPGRSGVRVTFAVDSLKRLLFDAESISVDVDERGDIRRFVMYHGAYTQLLTTEYTVERIVWNPAGYDPSQSVLEHFFDEAGNLRPAYGGYRIVRR